MTLQKAMRVRSELKKAAANLSDLMKRVPYEISFLKTPSDEELAAKREEKLVQLDGFSYEEMVKKQLSITEAILELNLAIEKANRKGHDLLFKEAAIKSKLSYINKLIENERNVKAEGFIWEFDFEDSDNKNRKKKVPVYNYSIMKKDALGLPLNDLRKSLQKELENVRDELSAFNATAKINYEIPEGLL